MKQLISVNKVIILILAFFLISATVSIATLVPVDIIESNPTTHIAFQDSPYTTITMSWRYTGTENIDSYFYEISAAPYTINYDSNDREISNTVSDPIVKEHGSYYLYIAPFRTIPGLPPTSDKGPVTKYGPLIVDTKAPENVSIGPENHTSDKSQIELTIGADEQIAKINVSEGMYGDGTWEDVDGSTFTYDLKQGEKKYTLRIQVMDKAGENEYEKKSRQMNDLVRQHITNADPYEITYTTADDLIMAKFTSVPTLSQWGMLIFLIILICTGVFAKRRMVPAVR
jgi:hypothetical protein